ncbi:MAG: phage holin family protein [Noviherbaspirillum sp.]|jgi:uncharacterized membrane protein YqjE|nr:phage holin family protein [Noviherbaspirillum sp.]
MFSALHTLQKSKTISMIALDRVGDYLDLLKVEMKIRENDLVMRIAGYASAALFGLLATFFLGVAIIVSFWDSNYRVLAAWFVVVLYGAIAAISLKLCLKHLSSQSLTGTLRTELHRDIEVIKESL